MRNQLRETQNLSCRLAARPPTSAYSPPRIMSTARMTSQLLATSLALISVTATSFAQAVFPPALSPEVRQFVSVDAPVVALIHARVIDGTGAAPRLDQTIILDHGSIRSVG